jgi:hypothetical protein
MVVSGAGRVGPLHDLAERVVAVDDQCREQVVATGE